MYTLIISIFIVVLFIWIIFTTHNARIKNEEKRKKLRIKLDLIHEEYSKKENYTNKYIKSDIKGIQYRDIKSQNRAKSLKVGEEVILEKEPTNIYDRYAIRIITEDGYFVGYFSKYINKDVYFNMSGDYSKAIITSTIVGENYAYISIKYKKI